MYIIMKFFEETNAECGIKSKPVTEEGIRRVEAKKTKAFSTELEGLALFLAQNTAVEESIINDCIHKLQEGNAEKWAEQICRNHSMARKHMGVVRRMQTYKAEKGLFITCSAYQFQQLEKCDRKVLEALFGIVRGTDYTHFDYTKDLIPLLVKANLIPGVNKIDFKWAGDAGCSRGQVKLAAQGISPPVIKNAAGKIVPRVERNEAGEFLPGHYYGRSQSDEYAFATFIGTEDSREVHRKHYGDPFLILTSNFSKVEIEEGASIDVKFVPTVDRMQQLSLGPDKCSWNSVINNCVWCSINKHVVGHLHPICSLCIKANVGPGATCCRCEPCESIDIAKAREAVTWTVPVYAPTDSNKSDKVTFAETLLNSGYEPPASIKRPNKAHPVKKTEQGCYSDPQWTEYYCNINDEWYKNKRAQYYSMNPVQSAQFILNTCEDNMSTELSLRKIDIAGLTVGQKRTLLIKCIRAENSLRFAERERPMRDKIDETQCRICTLHADLRLVSVPKQTFFACLLDRDEEEFPNEEKAKIIDKINDHISERKIDKKTKKIGYDVKTNTLTKEFTFLGGDAKRLRKNMPLYIEWMFVDKEGNPIDAIPQRSDIPHENILPRTKANYKRMHSLYHSTMTFINENKKHLEEEVLASHRDIREFSDLYIGLHGKLEGNYIHDLTQGHIIQQMLADPDHNLSQWSQQGWEALNKELKTVFYSQTNHGASGEHVTFYLLFQQGMKILHYLNDRFGNNWLQRQRYIHGGWGKDPDDR